MIFVMIYVSFDMILGAYLIGNMTALIVKGSRTERFRDKMKEVIRYMNRNKLGKEIREQIKGHLRLQYESSCTEASVLRDIPVSIRAKVMIYILDILPLFQIQFENFFYCESFKMYHTLCCVCRFHKHCTCHILKGHRCSKDVQQNSFNRL